MSVGVSLEELQQRVDEYGAHPFLVTTGEAGSHVVSVRAGFDGEQFSLSAGRTSRANVTARPAATLLWPGTGGPYALLVDGEARADDERETVFVRPTRAVLHRLADADGDLPSCVRIETADQTAG